MILNTEIDGVLPEQSVLDEASVLVDGIDRTGGLRQLSYGTPAENHLRTSRLWSAYLGMLVTPRMVCMMNILQKVSRDANASKRDNLVDICGYARCAELIDET